MRIRKKSFKILLSGIVLVTYLVLSFCMKAQSNETSVKTNSNRSVSGQNTGYSSTAKKAVSKNDDKMVTVSVVNFGRKNPFKPYKKFSVVTGDLGLPSDIPPPPEFNPTAGSGLRELMAAKVSGILYDPDGKSVAIINVKGMDYMVRQSDSIYGYYVQKITKNRVTLRYGNNTYSASVGDVIGQGELSQDPVVRGNQSFGGMGYKLPSINTSGL